MQAANCIFCTRYDFERNKGASSPTHICAKHSTDSKGREQTEFFGCRHKNPNGECEDFVQVVEKD